MFLCYFSIFLYKVPIEVLRVFFFFAVLGFEFRVLYLLGWCSNTEPFHQPTLVIVEMGSHELFAQAGK
jgi:hypothetical protein